MNKAMVRKLQKQLNKRKVQVGKLQHENSQLHTRHSILLSYCHCLIWLRSQADSSGQQQAPTLAVQLGLDAAVAGADIQQLLQELEQAFPVGLQQPHLMEPEPQHLQPPPAVPSTSNSCGEQSHPQHHQAKIGTAAAAAAPGAASGSCSTSGACDSHLSGWSGGSGAAAQGATGAASAAAAAPGGVGLQHEPTVAPDDDLLCLFKSVYGKPPLPGAADMSLQDVKESYSCILRDISLNLAQHEAHSGDALCGRAALPGLRKPLENIRSAFDRWLNLLASLAQAQAEPQHRMCMSLSLVNFADPSAEMLQEPDMQEHIRCMRMAGLSAQQQQQVTAGFAVFSRLMEPVLQEMRQLQLKELDNAAAPNDTATDAAAAAAAGTNGGPSHSNSSAMLTAEGYRTHREEMYQQEQRTVQLEQLMQKDILLRVALYCYTFGRFTYSQLAKLHVVMYPWHPAFFAVVRSVAHISEEEQQPQQHGRRQPQQD